MSFQDTRKLSTESTSTHLLDASDANWAEPQYRGSQQTRLRLNGRPVSPSTCKRQTYLTVIAAITATACTIIGLLALYNDLPTSGIPEEALLGVGAATGAFALFTGSYLKGIKDAATADFNRDWQMDTESDWWSDSDTAGF